MSSAYSFNVSTEHDPRTVLEMIFKGLGSQYAPKVSFGDEVTEQALPFGFDVQADWTVTEGIGGTWTLEAFQESLGISPNVELIFWPYKNLRPYVDELTHILRGTMYILHQIPGDAVLKINNVVLFYRKDGKLFLNTYDQWRPEDDALVTLPYERKAIPPI